MLARCVVGQTCIRLRTSFSTTSKRLCGVVMIICSNSRAASVAFDGTEVEYLCATGSRRLGSVRCRSRCSVEIEQEGTGNCKFRGEGVEEIEAEDEDEEAGVRDDGFNTDHVSAGARGRRLFPLSKQPLIRRRSQEAAQQA